jgi:hypothetical protein
LTSELSVTVTFNKGALSAGTCYAYVVNNAQEASAGKAFTCP